MKLHEFVDRFREDLVYKAPEVWPGQVSWFLAELKRRYEDVAEMPEQGSTAGQVSA